MFFLRLNRSRALWMSLEGKDVSSAVIQRTMDADQMADVALPQFAAPLRLPARGLEGPRPGLRVDGGEGGHELGRGPEGWEK